MITVENFYWVLFNVLLKPCELGCRYFYPFGTTDNLSIFEFEPLRAGMQNEHHSLFHFDQEPIYPESEKDIYRGTISNHFKTARLLANSEISDLKKTICKDYSLLDWYYFYHGFAALNWYQDTQYININTPFTHTFLSLNHLVRHKRSYRMSLTARLMQRDLARAGLISFFGTQQDCHDEIADPYTHLSTVSQQLIEHHLIPSRLPSHIDMTAINGDFSARMGWPEYHMRQKALWHVVNETIFYDQKVHLTEKVFQPIVTGRPFILVSAPGNLRYLRRYGFQTFDRWIDESYDDIQDADQRLDAVVHVLDGLVHQPRAALDAMFADMLSVLEHNKRHFFGAFRRMIVDEMVDNFDTCVRIWNNGRVDGRNITPHPDLGLAREILLR